MKRNMKEIRKEMKKRNIDVKDIQELLLGGIMFAVEDLEEELKK